MLCFSDSFSQFPLLMTAKIILQSGLLLRQGYAFGYNMQHADTDPKIPRYMSPHQVLSCYFNWSRKKLLSASYGNKCL